MLAFVVYFAVAVLNAWRYYVVEQKGRTRKLRKFLARLTNQETFNAFMVWRHKVLQRNSLMRMIKVMMNRKLSAALNKWSVSVKSRRKARAEAEVQLLQHTLAAHQQEADAAKEARRQALLERATVRLSIRAVGAAWRKWAEHHRVLKLGKKVMGQLIRRQLGRTFKAWWNDVRADRRARTEARLKLATVEVNAKQMALHTQMEKHTVVQDRIASMLCRLRTRKELRLRFQLAFKHWQLHWLVGRNAQLQQRERDVRTEMQNETSGRLQRQIANLEAELSQVKKSLADATNALHRKGAEEQTLRAQAKSAQSSAHQSMEAMQVARDLEAERVRQLEEELASQKRATQAAKNAAEAQKVALERANVVHKEELYMMQEETEQCPLSHSFFRARSFSQIWTALLLPHVAFSATSLQ